MKTFLFTIKTETGAGFSCYEVLRYEAGNERLAMEQFFNRSDRSGEFVSMISL